MSFNSPASTGASVPHRLGLRTRERNIHVTLGEERWFGATMQFVPTVLFVGDEKRRIECAQLSDFGHTCLG